MLYRELSPSPALRERVESIWILDQPAPGAQLAAGAEPVEKIVPDGRGELIFNLGAPYRRLASDPDTLQPSSFAMGPIRSYLEVVPTGRVSILGIRLRPHVMHRLLRAPMGELTDTSVPLDAFGTERWSQLEEELHAATDWATRVERAQAALQTCLADSLDLTALTDAAIECILRTGGVLDIGALADELGTSRRTLDRHFAREVGISPKLLSRQIRFRRVFDLISRSSPGPRNLAEVALAAGCYDQAHLNREFRAFAGQSPSAYFAAKHELSDHLTGIHAGGLDS